MLRYLTLGGGLLQARTLLTQTNFKSGEVVLGRDYEGSLLKKNSFFSEPKMPFEIAEN